MKPYNHRIGVFVGDTGAPRGEPNCLTVSLEGVAFVEKISGKSAKDACEKIVASETKRMSKKLMDAIVADKDARIAELTAEVGRYQDDLRVDQHAARFAEREVAELNEKVASLRDSLTKIAEWPDGGSHYGQTKIKDIARNALKDGV